MLCYVMLCSVTFSQITATTCNAELYVLLQNKLAKEERATRFNMNKLNHQWRTIMREAKSKELKKDLEILSQTFERVVDRKESVVKSLGKDLLEAEEQYSMALRSHLQNVDNLIG